jgi:hypothetical protein
MGLVVLELVILLETTLEPVFLTLVDARLVDVACTCDKVEFLESAAPTLVAETPYTFKLSVIPSNKKTTSKYFLINKYLHINIDHQLINFDKNSN